MRRQMLVRMNAAAAAPWLPFRMRDLAVSFYRCLIDLFLRHEHPRSRNENLVTIVECAPSGAPTASSGRMKIDVKVRLEGAR